MAATPKVTVLRSSTGSALRDGDILMVRYQGYLVDESGRTREQFDANYDFSTFSPMQDRALFQFQLGAGFVIQGWEIGLANRRIGEVIELTIPPSLGYGSTPTERIPANSTLRFRVEIVGGLTAETFSPGLDPTFTYTSLKDLGLDAVRLGLKPRDVLSASSSTVGLNTSDTLTGKDLPNLRSFQNNARDLLIGLKGNDEITGRTGGDFLIGGGGRDTFRYASLNESMIGEMDRIYDLQIGADRIDGPVTISSANIKELGKITGLTQSGIQMLLGTKDSELGSVNFGAHKAATFSLGTGSATRTFLAINNDTAGFDSSTDGLIEITGFRGSLTALAVI